MQTPMGGAENEITENIRKLNKLYATGHAPKIGDRQGEKVVKMQLKGDDEGEVYNVSLFRRDAT